MGVDEGCDRECASASDPCPTSGGEDEDLLSYVTIRDVRPNMQRNRDPYLDLLTLPEVRTLETRKDVLQVLLVRYG